jgi:thiamine phosphate synthase YjbQ (UPF0047 family)
VREIVARSGVEDGVCVVYTHHTTCAVMIQEQSFDVGADGLEFMERDLLEALEHMLPTCRPGGLYAHPGPQAVAFAAEQGETEGQAHNTDAHLRSALLGRSETVPVLGGKLDLGLFGQIYLVDFDQTRPREREAQVVVMGGCM